VEGPLGPWFEIDDDLGRDVELLLRSDGLVVCLLLLAIILLVLLVITELVLLFLCKSSLFYFYTPVLPMDALSFLFFDVLIFLYFLVNF
jgi:hypothetical protein